MTDQGKRERFRRALAGLGGSAGNGKLRETLGWDEAEYDEVKRALIAEGAIVSGRGRGGSVSLPQSPEDIARATEALKFPKVRQADAKIAQADAPAAAPAKPARTNANGNGKGGDLGFEAELFKAADKLRGNMEPSDYKHVALGLIFLKHISDSFEAKRAGHLVPLPRPPRRRRQAGGVGLRATT